MFVETNWVNKKKFDKKIALNCNNIPYIDNHITDSIPMWIVLSFVFLKMHFLSTYAMNVHVTVVN